MSRSEINDLRCQLAHLKGIEQRCHKAEKALKAFEERTRLIGDSAPLGIFTVDTQGCFTGINRKMRRLLAWPSNLDMKTVNLKECEVIAASGVYADIERCTAQKQPAVVSHPHTDSQGNHIHLRYYLSPVLDNHGTVKGAPGHGRGLHPFKAG